MRRGQEEFAVGIAMTDVFDAGAAFGESHVAVCDYGGRAGRMKGFVFGRCEEGRAVVGYKLVGDVELFAEPGEALGLGDVEVVDCEDHGCESETRARRMD